MNKIYQPFLLYLTFILFSLPFSSHAQLASPQQARVKIDVKAKFLHDVLKDIENQTGYQFNYDESEVNSRDLVTISSSSNLDALLKGLSAKLGLEFSFTGNYIAIRKAAKVNKPFRMITGVVTESKTGLAVPGVNVVRKGAGQAVITNTNGEYTMRLTGDNIDGTVLVFSYIGMKKTEVTVGKQSFISIAMEDDVFGMDEVVVTGSYTPDKRREDVVGSISYVNAKALQVDRPIESFDKLLEGLVAGVQVETTTTLNTPVKINIRGMGSLPTIGSSRTTSSQPLFVVDGIPMYEQQRGNESSDFSNEDYLNPLSNINVDDIKSISILKDATASALYGANAANGVVIITTKGGTAGRTMVNFRYTTGVATFINEYKWLSGPQYYSLLREAYINGGTSATTASSLAGSSTINTDWLDLTTRNAVYHDAGMDVSGGSGQTTFRFSSGYLNQKASSLENDLQKVYLRLNLDHQFSDKFKVGINLSPTLTKSNALSNYGAASLLPNLAPYTADGGFTKFLGIINPMAALTQNENSNKGVQLMVRTNASYKLTNEITLSGTLGAESYQNKQTQFNSGLNATGENVNGRLVIYDRNYLSYTGFLQATYDKTFNKHTLNFLAGTQFEDQETDLLRGQGTGFTFDRLRTLSSASIKSSSSSKSSSATISYYSQVGYDFDKKYYATFNLRADKSSIFGGDKQVALNGSLGFGYILSKEDFLKDNKTLTFLRLRTTYGATGNSRIGNYSARGLYAFGTGSSTYNGNVISVPDGSAAPNPDLGWEKNLKLNFGLDFTLYNKVQVTAEYYSNTIHDLISSVDVPLETGFTTISANTGKMRNKGFELSVNANAIERKNFSWNIAWNLGANQNKLLAYNNSLGSIFSATGTGYGLVVGNSTSDIYGYRLAGVDPATGTEQFYGPDGTLKTAKEILELPLASASVIGNRLPDFQGGLVNNFTLKNFTFSFNVLYNYGGQQLFSYLDEAYGRNLSNRNQSVNLIDRWQRPGDITDIPQLLINRSVVINSSRYLADISYLKLSNVAFGYKFSDRLTSRLHMNNLSVFANATNLLYIYKDRGTKGRNGVAEKRFVYPETMAFTAGVKIGL